MKNFSAVISIILVLSFVPLFAGAQTWCGPSLFPVPCPTSGAGPASANKTFGMVVIAVIDILLLVAGSIAVIFLIIGGYRYVVARGNEEAMEEAKKTMTSAILGLVVILMSFVVIQIIATILISGAGGLGL